MSEMLAERLAGNRRSKLVIFSQEKMIGLDWSMTACKLHAEVGQRVNVLLLKSPMLSI